VYKINDLSNSCPLSSYWRIEILVQIEMMEMQQLEMDLPPPAPAAEDPFPILPGELVYHITSYLGKNDLLNCRLVCQQWNAISVEHLTKDYSSLDCQDIRAYIHFVRTTNATILCPFQIVIDASTVVAPVPGQLDFITIGGDLESLMHLAGTSCVTVLKLRNVPPMDHRGVYIFFILERVEEGLQFFNWFKLLEFNCQTTLRYSSFNFLFVLSTIFPFLLPTLNFLLHGYKLLLY